MISISIPVSLLSHREERDLHSKQTSVLFDFSQRHPVCHLVLIISGPAVVGELPTPVGNLGNERERSGSGTHPGENSTFEFHSIIESRALSGSCIAD
jgi:hypothetical protein